VTRIIHVTRIIQAFTLCGCFRRWRALPDAALAFKLLRRRAQSGAAEDSDSVQSRPGAARRTRGAAVCFLSTGRRLPRGLRSPAQKPPPRRRRAARRPVPRAAAERAVERIRAVFRVSVARGA
jgi:hypothetical protein